MTRIDSGAHLQTNIERFFADYVRLLDDKQFEQWLNLFLEDSFYGVIRYEDHQKDTDFYIVADSKDKLRVRVKLGVDTEGRMQVHLITGPRIDDAKDGVVNASCNFAVFCENIVLYSGQYKVVLATKDDASLKIKRCLAIIANQQPNELFYLPL